MRILLIDDDKDDQALFCEAVARIEPKLQIEVAENGEQGIVNLASKVDLPVLVFLDINMPVLNGWDTLDLIRSNPGMSGSRVVIYSTSSQQADKARAERFGASFISKSNSFENMVQSLSTVIRQAIQEYQVVKVKELIREPK